jgi:predicted Fe-Mo cluster-binding NifX family protein
MKIAVPSLDRKVCMHFGHCEEFALVEVDEDSRKILNLEYSVPPAHAPGVLPNWLGEKGVNFIIAGGIGSRARQLFVQRGIKVIAGAPSDDIESTVQAYLNGSLEVGDNICDH